jgi:hypothetical protein
MLYAILAYHVEEDVMSWTPEEDAALMLDLNKVHDRLTQEERMGPAARLGPTKGACVLRDPGNGMVTDGPFTKSKEQLLGFYVIDCADREAATSLSAIPDCVEPVVGRRFAPIRWRAMTVSSQFDSTRPAPLPKIFLFSAGPNQI